MHRNAEKIRRENAHAAEIDELFLIEQHRRSPEEEKDDDRRKENARRNVQIPHEHDLIEQQTEIPDAEADAAADEIPQKENVAEEREEQSDRQDHPHAEQRRVQQVRAHGIAFKQHGERDFIHGAALEIAARLRKEIKTKNRQICYDKCAAQIDHIKHPSRQSIRRRSGGITLSYHIPKEKGTET